MQTIALNDSRNRVSGLYERQVRGHRRFLIATENSSGERRAGEKFAIKVSAVVDTARRRTAIFFYFQTRSRIPLTVSVRQR